MTSGITRNLLPLTALAPAIRPRTTKRTTLIVDSFVLITAYRVHSNLLVLLVAMNYFLVSIASSSFTTCQTNGMAAGIRLR